MNHVVGRMLMWGLYVLGILISTILSVIFPSLYLYFIIAGGGIMFLGFASAVLFLRCPECRGALDIHGLPPVFCPHCGEKIG
jgi:hypothetical protein